MSKHRGKPHYPGQSSKLSAGPRGSRRAFLGGSATLGLGAAATQLGACLPEKDGSEGKKKLPFIGLEEHFATKELMELNNFKFPKGAPRFDILDVAEGRIAHMDEAGLNVAVLSALTPGAQNLPGKLGIEYATRLNNWVKKEVVDAYPDRFKAFATVALTSPEAAADELERAVNDLGCLGCMTYGSINNKFLDDPSFEPFLARAEALGAPIYIHPAKPSPEINELYYKNLGNDKISWVLAGPGYGWHQEVALQSLRMICAGVFDKFPKLQIIVGHMGEGLPFYYWRFGDDLARATKDVLDKPVQQYLHDNFWITPSAFFTDELLKLALSVMGEDRILFATDYPFVSAVEGTKWFRATDIPRETKEKIAYKNAEKLFGLTMVS